MIKRLLLIVLCLVAASICYAQSSDQPADKPQDQPVATDQQPMDQPVATQQNTMVNGTISNIDHKKMVITIKDDATKDKKDFTFTDTTTLTKDGAAITHADLKKGDHVTLELDAQNALLKIEVTPKPSTEPKKDEKKDSEKPQ
jgi:hypothetical protein